MQATNVKAYPKLMFDRDAVRSKRVRFLRTVPMRLVKAVFGLTYGLAAAVLLMPFAQAYANFTSNRWLKHL